MLYGNAWTSHTTPELINGIKIGAGSNITNPEGVLRHRTGCTTLNDIKHSL